MNEDPQEGQSVVRRYWWAFLIALFLIALCCGVLGGAFGRDLIDRLVGNDEPTEPAVATETASEPAIDIPTDSPTATDVALETETVTATPSESPTPTVTPTATKLPGPAITCKCEGQNYVCSNGSVTPNSSRCPTPIPPTATVPPAACTAGWLPSAGCTCCGYDLWCADGSIGIFNPRCACTCQGTTLVCADGGSVPNAEQCGGKP